MKKTSLGFQPNTKGLVNSTSKFDLYRLNNDKEHNEAFELFDTLTTLLKDKAFSLYQRNYANALEDDRNPSNVLTVTCLIEYANNWLINVGGILISEWNKEIENPENHFKLERLEQSKMVMLKKGLYNQIAVFGLRGKDILNPDAKIKVVQEHEPNDPHLHQYVKECVQYWNVRGMQILERNRSGEYGNINTQKDALITSDLNTYQLNNLLLDVNARVRELNSNEDSLHNYECGLSGSHLWIHENGNRVIIVTPEKDEAEAPIIINKRPEIYKAITDRLNFLTGKELNILNDLTEILHTAGDNSQQWARLEQLTEQFKQQ